VVGVHGNCWLSNKLGMGMMRQFFRIMFVNLKILLSTS
jgi:hypothetical protein